MSKTNQILFELVTHNTIQHQVLHSFLIIVDYYPILISSLTSISKIQKFGNSLDDITDKLKFFKTIFPYRLINGGIDNKLAIVLLAAIGFFLLLYFGLIFLLHLIIVKQKNSGAFIQKNKVFNCFGTIFVNLYDIAFFRYGSSYIILFLCNLIIHYLYKDETTISSVLYITFIIIFMFYILTTYHHINTYFVIIQISNEAISKDKGKYVYDIIFSRPFDNIMLIIKIIVGIEYSYTNLRNSIDYFSVTLNLLIIVLVLLVNCKFSFQLGAFKKLDNYIFNKNLNLVRMFLTIFNIYFVIVSNVFFRVNTHISILVILFALSMIWAFFTILLIWILIIKPQFFDGQITLQKLLYIMVQSKKEASLVITTGESFFNVNLIKIQDSIEFNHRINCIEFSKCNLCKKYTNKQAVTVFDLYKYIIKRDVSDSIIHNEVDILYRDLIKLFYYHIKKKIFRFYSWYRKIYIKFDKVDKTVVNNLSYIISLCLSYYDTYGLATFSEVFQFTNINQMIESHLSNIKNFIVSANELKYVDKFFALSRDIRKLRDYTLYILKHIEIKDDYYSNTDNFTRNVKNIYRYNLLINRFVVETLTNHQYKELNQLNIEMFDDYLTSHFNQDKLLMINLDMDHENQHNDQGIISNNSYNILKCGRELISYRDKTFIDLLPKKLKKHGLNYFISKLGKYIDYDTLENYVKVDAETKEADMNANGEGANNTSMFQYIIKEAYDVNEISLLQYSFKVSRSLVDEHLLIYGYYSGMNNKVMVFEMNSSIDTNNVKDGINMKLINFSRGIKNLLLLNSEWIDVLDKSNNHIYFHTLFKSFSHMGKNSGFTYEGTLDYNQYIVHLKHYTKLVKEYLENEINNNNNENNINSDKINEIEVNLTKIMEKAGKTLTMRFKLLFEIELNIRIKYRIYSVYLLNKNKQQQGDGNNNIENWDNNNAAIASETSVHNSTFENPNNTYTGSNTSMTENSVSARLSTRNRSHKEMKFSSAINTQNSKVDKISKAFSTFSILIVILNALIILLCIIFLIVQIIQTNCLKKVNNLNYEFKRIRIAFAHSFLSVFTNGCLARLGAQNCQSYYDDYSQQLIRNYDYPEEYNVRDYLVAEIKYKINDMQTTFYSFKEDLYSYGDDSLQSTLLDKMTYTSFEQKNNELVQQSLEVSLEEGFRKYINAFTVLINSEPNFTKVPIYIISFRNSIVDFSNMENKNLSEVQTQIYLILINYINYSLIFKNSETSLEKEYDKVANTNTSVMILFMVLIAFFNFVLFILCIWNISIVTQLFLNFIMGMIMVMSDADFKLFYAERIDDLIKLSQLYVKNPNNLLHNIKKDEVKIAKKLNENNKRLLAEKHNQSQNEKDYLLKAAELTKDKSKNIYVDVSKIKIILLPFFVKLSALFIFYFIVLVVFDVILFSIYNNLFNVNDYIIDNFLVETQIYDILVLTQIMTLLNLTQNDFANSLGITNPEADGVINMKIRETAAYIKSIQNDQANSASAFEVISDFFNSKNCSYIFRNVENELTKNTSEAKGIDYFEFQSLLCEKFEIMSLDSFEFMFNDYILRVQKLQNLISAYTYDDLYAFNTQYEFYDLVTMILMNLQPIRNYIRTVLLDNLMNKTINDFITLIAIYLCVNILLDLTMFFIIRFKIAGKLDKMHRDLLMFNDCFSM